MGRRKFEDAIGAFKKQIELEPYDETAYNNLASVYQELGKNEEAASAYQKQIEISPLDKFAHYGLGSSTLTRRNIRMQSTNWRGSFADSELAARLCRAGVAPT